MTTAYTSLLGLALPVTGELSGTWGDVVNNSITSLLDSAVAGTTNVSTDADVTLTTTTGAANTAREAILLFSGARTAVRTVTAPAQSKIYTVINATTGGFAVTLVGAGPTTGLTIPNGGSAVVAWNGSDFVEIGNFTIGNLVVNGNIGVGVTPSAWESGWRGVEFKAAGNALFSGGNSDVRLTSGAYYNGGWKYGVSGSAVSYYYQGAGAHSWYTAASGPAGNTITFTQAMTLDASGNLALGSTSILGSTNRASFTNNVSTKGVLALSNTSSSGYSAVELYDNAGGQQGAVGWGNGSVAVTGAQNATYLYSSGAITFLAGGTTERARIDSSGNFTVGFAASPYNSAKMEIYRASAGDALMLTSPVGTGTSNAIAWSNSRGDVVSARIYNADDGAYGAAIVFANRTGQGTTTTERVRIDTAGKLAIATTTSNGYLTIKNTNPSTSLISIQSYASTTEIASIKFDQGTDLLSINTVNVAAGITFGTNGTERMRLDSAGGLRIGGGNTVYSGVERVTIDSGSGTLAGGLGIKCQSGSFGVGVWNQGSGTQILLSFAATGSGTAVGSIITDGTSTSYNTSSDYRLKNTIAPMTGALAKVALLKPCTYKWNANGSDGQGFIAHELAEVVPQCVTGEKDAVNEDGSIKPQGIDTSFLIATLTAALQEQQVIIESQSVAIESLKARLDAANL